MTNPLTGLRSEVVNELKGLGYAAHEHMPQRITPPCFVVSPDAPYVNQTDSFVLSRVNLVITYITRPGSPSVVVPEMEKAVTDVIGLMNEARWDYTVDSPASIVAGDATYPGVEIHVSTDINL